MFTKEFEIRWSDIDANSHLGNSAYINFMSHTRMAFFIENGLSLSTLEAFGVGPVVFYEHVYYFREALLGVPVTVTLELAGLAADGRFFEFHHNFYDGNGTHLAHCEMMGAWIDLKTRKLASLAPELLQRLEGVERSPNFRVLTKEDTRKNSKEPKNLA
jgi:acyl-CoA thioester hydrolase